MAVITIARQFGPRAGRWTPPEPPASMREAVRFGAGLSDAPAVVADHPAALYLIAGQTHPELRRRDGERYRMAPREIIEQLLASDGYVMPYLEPQQITSDTLAYALGAGKAIVSTAYMHAREALAAGRGILVGFGAAGHLAEAVNSLLDHRDRKQALELSSYAYAKDMSGPRTAECWPVLMRLVLARSRTAPRLRAA